MEKLKLGIIGMSEGNGHPYSWSAIINGFDQLRMSNCPFPAIPEYLNERHYPNDFLSDRATVTHIWTQDPDLSKDIAGASLIGNICNKFEDMEGEVDAVLLARDDARNHLKFAPYFLEKGIPVYIDKPLAVTVADAKYLYGLEKYKGQIFSCSALRFAKELMMSTADFQAVGDIELVEAFTPKDWEKYAIHIIDPVLNLVNHDFDFEKSKVSKNAGSTRLEISLMDQTRVTFTALGDKADPILINVKGSLGSKSLEFHDSFSAFRKALEEFLDGVQSKTRKIPMENNLLAVSLIELGL